MKKLNSKLERPAGSDLVDVIEPLANYICAAERPKEVLISALVALFDEVKATNHVALMHFSSRRVNSLGLVA